MQYIPLLFKMNPQQWLQNRFPNCRALDENWTFERYDYPENVRQWIRENWIKVSDNNGGTYHEPTYHREKFPHLYEKEVVNPEEQKDEKEDAPKEGQAFAQAYKETEFYDGMDDANKKAVNVMAEQGMEAAVKHMFTDEKSGRQLSYAEMRSLYG